MLLSRATRSSLSGEPHATSKAWRSPLSTPYQRFCSDEKNINTYIGMPYAPTRILPS